MLRSIFDRFKPKEISEKLEYLARKDVHQLTEEDLLTLRGTYKRFRVLVLGPANAGKTTLLERLSDSPAGAAIVTRDGKRIEEVPKGYDQRGIHRITDEITYASNPGFVFHDSGGFEAGGDEEIKTVWSFIRRRSSASPSEQLHGIWLCIPTDNDRPFGFLNSGFFSKSTGSVPVIGIFTKLDGRETIELVNLLGADPSPFDIVQCRSQVEQKAADFIHELETEFKNLPHPPAAFVRLGGMHNDDEHSITACHHLLQTTMGALPPGTLKLLLRVTIRNKNRRTYTVYILQRVLAGGQVGGSTVERTPALGENEESELRGDEAFRTLLRLDWPRHFGHDWDDWHLFVDDWVKACAPLLALSRQLSASPNPEVRYLVFICLVVLRIRRGRNVDFPDAPETEHPANSIQAQIDDELIDKENRIMKLNSRSMARRLAEIIDDYTPM